jgi:DNA primase
MKNTTKGLLKVFKPARKDDSVRTAYLHASGWVMVVFQRHDAAIDTFSEYVKAARLDGVRCHFKGRIVVHDFEGVPKLKAALALGLHTIKAQLPYHRSRVGQD